MRPVVTIVCYYTMVTGNYMWMRDTIPTQCVFFNLPSKLFNDNGALKWQQCTYLNFNLPWDDMSARLLQTSQKIVYEFVNLETPIPAVDVFCLRWWWIWFRTLSFKQLGTCNLAYQSDSTLPRSAEQDPRAVGNNAAW